MALAGSDHVVVTVQPHFYRLAGYSGGQCGDTGRLGCLAFLAAKCAAHATAFANHTGIGLCQGSGNQMLHFAWVLGGAMDLHGVVLARYGK